MSKINETKNDYTKSCSTNFKFLIENLFQKDLGGFRAWKFAFKIENALFLTALNYVVLHGITSIDFHLTPYEFPQPSPHYCTTTMVTWHFLWIWNDVRGLGRLQRLLRASNHFFLKYLTWHFWLTANRFNPLYTLVQMVCIKYYDISYQSLLGFLTR